MPVLGMGGFFFRAKDPGALSAWYHQHLGIGPTSPDEYAWSTRGGPLVFAPFEATTDYWPADKQVMINLRVSDLDGLLQTLRDNKIEIITDPEWDTPESGRFARIHDPEGNPIELWEPPA
ncbi:glyoxalase [Rhodococcoides trifolii]|uniref:Glyoxalase n=1 Tax=Rhodococcoides trifolii TaxID=908250 RepID=A0A917FMR0_9NOCA|nr:VOC family protein [Rhodococcus trifolii]GGF94325.1 glyoxalase [Rhodococcus trifolii]